MGKRKRRRSDSDDELLHKVKRRLERRSRHKRKRRDKENADFDSDHCYESEFENEPYPDSEDVFYLDSDEHSVRSVVVPKSPEEPTSHAMPSGQDEPRCASSNPPDLSKDILEILGDSKGKEETFGPKIREEVAKRWGKIIIDGLSKEHKQKIIEGVLIPENFQLIKAPKLNPEISAVLSESTRNRDRRLEKAQNHLGVGIAAITNLMATLIDGELDKTDIIKKLSEAGQLLLDLHNTDTTTRRQLITYSLDKKFFTMVRDVKRDAFLFGENLGEKIKASKSAEKSGIQIKRKFEPQPSTSTYRANRQANPRQGNSTRGPPRQFTQRGRSRGTRFQAPSQTSRRLQTMTDRYGSTSSKPNRTMPPSTRKSP